MNSKHGRTILAGSIAGVSMNVVIFGEPLHLIALELFFWACIAFADGMTIAAIMEKKP